MSKKVTEAERVSPIEKAKINAKVRYATEVFEMLNRPRMRMTYAVYRFRGGFLAVREKDGSLLYNHARRNGHKDPDFMGFYGAGNDAHQYFMEDVLNYEAA